MGFRAALISVIRAVSRPYLIIPAAFVAALVLLSPPAIDDASAQGFRMQSSRAGLFRWRPRPLLDDAGAGSSNGHDEEVRSPGRQVRQHASRTRRRADGHAAGWVAAIRPVKPTDNRHPKGDHRHPRWPRRPIYVPPTRGRRAGWTAAWSAVQRQWRRPAAVDAACAIQPAAAPTGAATCRTRWWSRSRPTSRRRPSTALMRRHRLTQLEIDQSASSAARRSAACGSTTAARFRPWCARWRPRAS